MGYDSLEGKAALITGGSEGIGFGIAKAFVEAGAKVSITGRNTDKLLAAKVKLEGKLHTITADITQIDLCQSTIDSVLGEFGKLDILINNAGAAVNNSISESTVEEFDFIFNTNVRGLFALTQSAIPELKKTGGCIINIASSLGIRGMPVYGVYSAAKAAVIMLTQLWAKDLAPDVRVNSISPGAINTPIYERLYGEDKLREALEFISGNHLTKRIGEPEDIARTAVYLATEDWVTGSNFVVDGGLRHIV